MARFNKRGFWDNARFIVPTSFEACMTYYQQILYLAKKIEELEERVAELEAKNPEETE